MEKATDYEVSIIEIMHDVDAEVDDEAVPDAATDGGSSSIMLSWQLYQEENTNADGSAPAVSYIVYCSDKADGGYEAVADGITQTGYTHTGLAARTTRYYKVTAVVTMDGKTGWADGQIGMAGYGEHLAGST